MARVSLCMIVRNEESRVPAFLAAAEGCYDQLVVVDTGSTDDTRDLFALAGADVHRFTWCDDFAAARNDSLCHAVGDWILILDADEFPYPSFAGELRMLIERQDVGAATIEKATDQRNGIPRRSRELRLFRRDPAIRYRRRIHEDASDGVRDMLRRTGTGFAHIAAPVRHLGRTPQAMAAKNGAERDERLLKLALDDDPGDLYARYKLMELYRFSGRTADMVPVARECLRRLRAGEPIDPPPIAGDLVAMIRDALMAGDAVAGLTFLTEMAPWAAHTGHYHLALGMQRELTNHPDRAASSYRETLRLATGDPAETLLSTRARMGLARLSLAAGDRRTAAAEAKAALVSAPRDPEALLLVQYLNARGPAPC